MKINLPWQGCRCARYLLLTINACKHRSMETKADTATSPEVAMFKTVDGAPIKVLTSGSGLQHNGCAWLCREADKPEDRTPDQTPQQLPGQRPQTPAPPTNQQAPAPNEIGIKDHQTRHAFR